MSYTVNYTGGTTNATQKEIYQADGTRFLIAASASYRLHGTCIAQNTVTIATHEWEFTILIKNVAGTTSIVGYPLVTDTSMDTGTEAWALSITADDTNDALAVKVTGALATTITWTLGFDYSSIGTTPAVVTPSDSLNVPQLMDMIKIHHPSISNNMILKMLNNAQKSFIKETKLNAEVSTISLSSQTLVGTTNAVPLTLTDTASDYTWSFYKDGSVNTIRLKPSTNVLFYTNISCVDSGGNAVQPYSISFADDGSISFFDDDNNELTDFESDSVYITFEFIKAPDILIMSSTSTPEIQSDYHESLTHKVISDLYMTRADLEIIGRLQMSKHFKNLYDEYKLKAKFEYNIQSNTFSVTSVQSEDFQSE